MKNPFNSLQHDESAEQLGVWINPDANETQQVSTLKCKLLEFGGKLRHSNASGEKAWVALNVHMKSKSK